MIQINEVVVICQVPGHVTESVLTVMDDVCILKEKTRKLEHEKCIYNHSARNRSLKIMLGKDCYHSVQNLLSSRLLSKNIKIRIYRTVILPVVLYGCETWSLTSREEHRLRVFENRRIF
jgi:hypothetical protein